MVWMGLRTFGTHVGLLLLLCQAHVLDCRIPIPLAVSSQLRTHIDVTNSLGGVGIAYSQPDTEGREVVCVKTTSSLRRGHTDHNVRDSSAVGLLLDGMGVALLPQGEFAKIEQHTEEISRDTDAVWV